MKPPVVKSQISVLFKYQGWLIAFLVFSFALSVFIFLKGNYLTFNIITPKKDIIDYLVRFMIFEIPASITVFSFVYKEKKDASYSHIKTSKIGILFFWIFGISFLTLIFSIITLADNPIKSPDIIKNIHQFNISIIYSIISLVSLIFYIVYLILNMEIRKTLKNTIKKAKKYQKILIGIYKQQGKFVFIKYNHILSRYNSLIESNFQLIMAAMGKNNLSDIDKELKKVYELSQDFYQNFVDVKDFDVLSKFLDQKEKTKNSNKDNLLEIYSNILLNYKFVIRQSSKLGLTKIQKQIITEFIALNPVKLYKYRLYDLKQDSFNELQQYYVELTETYHTALFEIIKEYSDENTVEYSYLLEKVGDTSRYFEQLNMITSKERDNQKVLNESLILKVLSLLEAIIVSAVESDNIRFLTETINILLRYYYTHIPYIDHEAKQLKDFFNEDSTNFLDDFIKRNPSFNKDFLTKIKKTPYFKQLIGKHLIRIIIHAMHKSIELGCYQCTGYLAKISCTHFTKKDFIASIEDYTMKIIERNQMASYDFGYYHYTINNFSKIYCLKKMALILSFQLMYRHNRTNLEDLIRLIKGLFNESYQDFNYVLEKVLGAQNKYGMLAIKDTDIKDELNIIFEVE